MPSPFRRLTAVSAFALWTAAGFGPLAVGLHAALHLRGHGEAMHTQHLHIHHVHSIHPDPAHPDEGHAHGVHSDHTEVRERALATRHGQPHAAEAMPGQEHRAVTRSATRTPKTSPSVVASLSPLSSGFPSGERPTLARTPHRGPPAPLFTAHCSLLL